MDFSSGSDSSLLVDSPINIEGLQGLDRSGWEEEVLDERGIDEISGCSAVYKGGGCDGSHSVL